MSLNKYIFNKSKLLEYICHYRAIALVILFFIFIRNGNGDVVDNCYDGKMMYSLINQ